MFTRQQSKDFFKKIETLSFADFSKGMEIKMPELNKSNHMMLYRDMHKHVQFTKPLSQRESKQYSNMTSPISLNVPRVPYTIVGSSSRKVYKKSELERIYKETGKDPMTRKYFTHIAKIIKKPIKK